MIARGRWQALGQIVRVTFLEQSFCEEFFHFSYDQPQPDSPSIIVEDTPPPKKDKKELTKSHKPTYVLHPSLYMGKDLLSIYDT